MPTVGRLTAALLDLADLPVDDREICDAAGLGTVQEDDELSPALRILIGEQFNPAAVVAERGQRVENAAPRAAPL